MPAGQQRAIKRSPESPTPVTDQRMHKHLRRLEGVWIDWPIYFVTTCTFNRRAILASKEVVEILVDEWRDAHGRHGLGDRAVSRDARPRALLLLSRVGCQNVTNIHAGLETVDK